MTKENLQKSEKIKSKKIRDDIVLLETQNLAILDHNLQSLKLLEKFYEQKSYTNVINSFKSFTQLYFLKPILNLSIW